jgi:hypothetical protein
VKNVLKLVSEEHQWISDFDIRWRELAGKVFLNLEQKQNWAV